MLSFYRVGRFDTDLCLHPSQKFGQLSMYPGFMAGCSIVSEAGVELYKAKLRVRFFQGVAQLSRSIQLLL
jgi:hypothetical protein